MSALLAALGTSIANVGLPAIADAFEAPFPAVQWIVLAYLLSTTTLVLGAGRLGDLIGRRRLLIGGLALFTGASLACALASMLWVLIAARAVQGVGAAVMMALAMALVGDTVPAAKTATAMGLLGTMSAVGTALGPSLGGVLLTTFDWRALFVLTVPIGLVTLATAHRHLPPDTRPTRTAAGSFHGVGMLLLAVTVGAYALAMTVPTGRFGAHRAGWLLATVIGAMLFVRVETRSRSPLVRLATLRDGGLVASLGANALVATVMMSTLLVGPFYLAQALSLEASLVGLTMSAGPLVAALAGVPAGRAVDRFGTRGSRLVGLGAMASGTILLAFTPTALRIAGYIAPMVVLTAGYALFQAANNIAVMGGANASERGALAGLLNLSRNLGLVTGASVMGALFALGVELAGPGSPATIAAGLGMRITFGAASVLVAGALALGLSRPTRRLGAAAMLGLVASARSTSAQIPGSLLPGRTAPTPAAPYPLVAAGWGPALGGGRFMSRWVEDWTGMRAAGTAPALKARSVARGASLTLNTESRLRHDGIGNGGLSRGNSYGQTLLRGTVGADLRANRHVRLYGEIGTGQIDRLRRAATAHFQNNASLQQLFVDVRGYQRDALFGLMVGRQEFADGPRQLVSLSDGPNVHRTWNGVRLYAHGRRARFGAFDLRVTRPAPGHFDEAADRGERLRGVNASVAVGGNRVGATLFLDPFWIRTERKRQRIGSRVGPDDRSTFGARLWGLRGPVALDWTLVHQKGQFAGRKIDAWGLFAVQSVTLERAAWTPRLELRVDVATGGTRGDKTVREFSPLYASSAYLGEGQFLGLRNLAMVTPGLTLSPTLRTRLAVEYGAARRIDPHDPVQAGGTRMYPGTVGTAHRDIGGLLRLSATHSMRTRVSLFLTHEYLNTGGALRRAGLPSGSYSHAGATFRY